MSAVIPEQGSATVSLSDAARILGVGKSTAYELVKRGEFPIYVITIGNKIRVPLVHIERFLLGDGFPSAEDRPDPALVGSGRGNLEGAA